MNRHWEQRGLAQLVEESPHTPIEAELPDIVADSHAIILYGHRYGFNFVEALSGPQDLGRITLYASDNILEMDETTLEIGLAAVDEHMQDLLDRDEPLSSPTIN